jgi:hypothetical protein
MVNNVIVKEKGKWYVKSEEGKNLGGPYDSKEEAMKRLKQVEHFKNNSFQSLVSNIKPIIRNDSMEGKDFLVVPMVMMVEGVHQGSSGPLYYPASELSKIPEVWNHKPVVVYHPEENGQGISACSPDILTNRKIGVIMNASFKNGKLKAEAWLDSDRIKKVDNRVLEAMEANQTMELSTGLFTDLQETEGEWNGEEYTAIAINYRPDHLAVLPDLVGACSVADGAGFLRVNAESDTSIVVTLSVSKEMTKYIKEHEKHIAQILSNELSHEEVRISIYKKMESLNIMAYVEAVHDEYFIYDQMGSFNKQLYTIKNGEVTFKGTPLDVKKTVTYNQETINLRKEQSKMDKKQLVDGLIANASTKWSEEDREVLMAMDEKALEKMIPVANAEPAPKKEVEVPAVAPVAPVANAKPVTAKEYIEQAPAEIQRVLRNGLSSYEAEKSRLIGIIKTNEKNPFSDEQLKSKDLDELRGIAVLASNKKEDKPAEVLGSSIFSGQGDPVVNTAKVEPMNLPVMNFEAAK